MRLQLRFFHPAMAVELPAIFALSHDQRQTRRIYMMVQSEKQSVRDSVLNRLRDGFAAKGRVYPLHGPIGASWIAESPRSRLGSGRTCAANDASLASSSVSSCGVPPAAAPSLRSRAPCLAARESGWSRRGITCSSVSFQRFSSSTSELRRSSSSFSSGSFAQHALAVGSTQFCLLGSDGWLSSMSTSSTASSASTTAAVSQAGGGKG
jgi:hypothetical protein